MKKWNHVVLIGFAVMSAALVFTACGDDDSSTGPGNGGAYKTATIDHWGFDFSAAKNDTTDWGANNDGYMIGWSPDGGGWGTGIWYSTYIWPNRTKSLGKIDITTITSIDTTATSWDVDPPALEKDDVIVAQCQDGFVKFKVVADVDTSMTTNPFWSIRATFLFSPTPSFNE